MKITKDLTLGVALIELLLFTMILVNSQNSSRLIFVIELFTHGAKGPTLNKLFIMGYQTGKLTPTGMRTQYILGSALKKDYPQFFDNNYNSKAIYAQSTNHDYTIASVYAQLYGIYQGKGPQLNQLSDFSRPPCKIDQDVLNEVSNETGIYALPHSFQPIPVHTVDPINDTLLLSYDNACPNFNKQYFIEGLNSPSVTKAYDIYQPVINQINKAINSNLTGPYDLLNFEARKHLEELTSNDIAS